MSIRNLGMTSLAAVSVLLAFVAVGEVTPAVASASARHAMHTFQADDRHTTLQLSTWNVGRGSLSNFVNILESTDALALQEAGDQTRLLRAARNLHRRVLNGTGRPGQSSTPLIYNPSELRLRRPFVEATAARQYAGPGAGPSTLKPKWLIGGEFVHRDSGRVVTIVSTHYVASSYRPVRHRIARHQTAATVRAFARTKHLAFLMGDFNTTPTRSLLQPLFAHGWTTDQGVAARRIGTHGRRAVDQVWWQRDGSVRLVRHWRVRTRSDHDALLTQFSLAERT